METVMKIKTIALPTLMALSLSACEEITYTAQQYQSSAANTISLQQLAARGERATVGEVLLAEGIQPHPTCRLAGPLDLGGGDNLADTIKQAVQTELLAGGVYRAGATPININVVALTPDSMNGQWTIGLQVYSTRSSGFTVQSVTDFSTNFSAYAACDNTATAFNRALSAAINKMISDPRFAQVI
jgi:hypothetical protein